MAILNYTTKIDAEKTVGEIQKLLVEGGARSVLCDYDDEGLIKAVSFRLPTQHGLLSFLLPARYEGVYKCLCEDADPRYCTHEQAARVCWRIVKDWIAAQLALVEAQQAEMAEVFLPYLQDPATGQTVYQKLESGGFKQLTDRSKTAGA